MSNEMTLIQASEKACQLASLLSAVSANRFDGVASVDGKNLVDLAGDLAGGVAVFLLELASEQGKAVVATGNATIDIGDELRRAESLLTAAAELHDGPDDEHEMSFELLDKVLFRLREIKEAYKGGNTHA